MGLLSGKAQSSMLSYSDWLEYEHLPKEHSLFDNNKSLFPYCKIIRTKGSIPNKCVNDISFGVFRMV